MFDIILKEILDYFFKITNYHNEHIDKKRKGFVKGSVEVWFDDKTKIDL